MNNYLIVAITLMSPIALFFIIEAIVYLKGFIETFKEATSYIGGHEVVEYTDGNFGIRDTRYDHLFSEVYPTPEGAENWIKKIEGIVAKNKYSECFYYAKLSVDSFEKNFITFIKTGVWGTRI